MDNVTIVDATNIINQTTAPYLQEVNEVLDSYFITDTLTVTYTDSGRDYEETLTRNEVTGFIVLGVKNKTSNFDNITPPIECATYTFPIAMIESVVRLYERVKGRGLHHVRYVIEHMIENEWKEGYKIHLLKCSLVTRFFDNPIPYSNLMSEEVFDVYTVTDAVIGVATPKGVPIKASVLESVAQKDRLLYELLSCKGRNTEKIKSCFISLTCGKRCGAA